MSRHHWTALAVGVAGSLASTSVLACASCRSAVVQAVYNEGFWSMLGLLLCAPVLIVCTVIAATHDWRRSA